MARSHREVFSFVVAVIVLYIGVVATMNCDSSVSGSKPIAPFCKNQTVSGREIYLSGVHNGINGIGCNCSITITKIPDEDYTLKIDIKNVTTTTKLCAYSLYSVYRNYSTRLYACNENVTKASFYLKPIETLRLHMEKWSDNGVGFPFCLQLYSDQAGSSIHLECTSKSTTTTASPTSLTYMKSTSTNHFLSTISNSNNIPTSSTGRNDDTIATLSTTLNSRTGGNDGTSYTTVKSNISGAFPPTTEQQPNNDDSNPLIGIIIGSILAVLVLVALVIVIICLVKRRRKKKPPCETPLEPQDNHVNAAVTPNNNANGHNNQNTQVGNRGMIYLENDLYKSIDDDEPVGRKGGNHEGMIYLENDLYISSSETDNVHQDEENSVPHQPVEYAVVNKTAKKSSSSNGASTGHTVGPHGDVYTFVQKK
ncbi:uncharacterized protein LOC126827554 [Patella vulgata]|uniref:uncharacterized protein LOC126827554 n=1 Tax=Patella vulgata TaxID=6465 RepID=UPI0024A84069|nr:uncharacterized protein LOC126827554 [Patella vulgata]